MKPPRPAEPVERVLPVAVLHVWADGIETLQRQLEAAAARIPGTEPVGTGRFVALPIAADAAVFDRAAALAELAVRAAPTGRPGAVRTLVVPGAVRLGATLELLDEPLLGELQAKPPAIEPGRVVLSTHAAHHLEGSFALEPCGNLQAAGGRLIPLTQVRPRAVAIPSWRNPEILSRTAKWVRREAAESELAERLSDPCVRLVGPFGVGKTRLVWEVLRAAGEPTIWRNAVAAGLPPIAAELASEASRPVWVVYDHLEAGGPQIWAEIEELLKHPQLGSELRLLLISRPAIAWPAELAGSPLVSLDVLADDAWQRCTAQLFRGLSLPDDVAAELAEGAGGNPFALEEALLSLVRDRQLRQVFGSFFYSGTDGSARFHPSRRYLAHAEAEALRLGSPLPLRQLAQLEQPTPSAELRSAVLALGGEPPAVDWEQPFLAAGMLVSQEGPWGAGVAFASRALRLAFGQTLSESSAARLRADLGELLAARSSSVEELWAAYALLRGSEAGARALLAAASAPGRLPREALFTALRQELAAHRERAGDPALEIDLLWVLLPLARRMGRLHELAPALERGFDLARELPQRFLAIAALRAELAQNAGRFAEAEWVLRQALAVARDAEPRRQELLLIELGRVLVREGKTGEASELFTKTLAVAERRRRPGLAATCRFFLGNIAFHELRLNEAAALHREALEVRRSKGGGGVAASLSALGAVALAQGNFPGSLAHYEEARRVLADEKGEADEAFALIGIGRALLRLGDFAAAAPVLRRALELREGRDDAIGEAIARLAVAESQLLLDQVEGALGEARRALFALSLVPASEALADGEQLVGRVQLKLRRPEAAIGHLEEAARLHRELGKEQSLLADLAYRLEAEIALGKAERIAAAYAALAEERERAAAAGSAEHFDFCLYLGAEWLGRKPGAPAVSPRFHLERAYRELMRQTSYLEAGMRQRFLFQLPVNRAIVEAATRLGLSLA